MSTEEIRLLKRVDEKLTHFLNREKKKNWVKVVVVQKVTGWGKAFLRTARENGLVEVREKRELVDGKEKVVLEYLLESIPEILIRKF